MTCSRRPTAEVPRPSKLLGLIPRKSLTRGSATEMNLSRNSHIRSLRSVPLAPIGIPSRILNPAMLLRARRIWGFWPVILARSSTAPSSARLFTSASPTPLFATIFSRPGILIGFWMSNLSLRAGAISSLYLSFSLAIDVPPGLLGDPDLLPRVREPAPDLGRLPAAGVHQHHVRDVYGGVESEEPLLVCLARPGVAGARVHVVYDHAVLLGYYPLDLAALAFVLAGDHDDRVPALYLETHKLEHLRGQRDDPRVALLSELARHRPEDAGPPRSPVLVDDDAGVLAEAYVRPVVPARLLLGPHHDRPHDLALLDGAAGGGLLDRRDDHVADTSVPEERRV